MSLPWSSKASSTRRRLSVLVVVPAAVIFVGLWALVMSQYYGTVLEDTRARAARTLDHVEARLSQLSLEHRTRLDALAAFVATTGFDDLTESEFRAFAQGLTHGREEIRNISVAPEAVQRFVYPLEGNESVLGHDLLEDGRPQVRSDVRRALAGDHIVSSGPYNLRQNGYGLVIRRSVNRSGEPWGLVAMVLDTPAAVEAVGLSPRIEEFNIGIRTTDEGEVLYGTERAFSSRAVDRTVGVFDRQWQISAYPDGGFPAIIPTSFWIIFWLTLGAAVIATLFVYLIFTRQSALSARLHRRTKDLSEQLRERLRVEENLETKNALLESISEASPVGILAGDREGTVTFANAYTARALRVPQEQLIGRRLDALEWGLELLEGGESGSATFPYREVMQRGTPIFNRRYRLLREDKVWIISVNGAPIPDSDEASPVLPLDEEEDEAVPVDDPVGVVLTIKDVTEQVESEEYVRRALREKDVLLREIHHRVKNNLNIITSLLSLQQSRIEDAEAAVAAFSDTRNRVHALAQLHQMLYRSESLEVIDLAEYIEDAVLSLQHSYDPHGTASVGQELESVLVDMDHAIPAGLIFTELFTNAVEHGLPEEGTGAVDVKLTAGADNIVTLEVADQGEGLPPESERARGASLGLELVNALTQQLHGTLDVDSGASGTRFRLTFSVNTH